MLLSAGNHQQNEKAPHEMGKNTFRQYGSLKWLTNKRLIFKIYKELIQMKNKTKK